MFSDPKKSSNTCQIELKHLGENIDLSQASFATSRAASVDRTRIFPGNAIENFSKLCMVDARAVLERISRSDIKRIAEAVPTNAVKTAADIVTESNNPLRHAQLPRVPGQKQSTSDPLTPGLPVSDLTTEAYFAALKSGGPLPAAPGGTVAKIGVEKR